MKRLLLLAVLLAGCEATDEPTTLSGHGLAVRIPDGWEGGIRPGPVLRARADGALVVLRDVTALYAPLAEPLGFPAARPAAARKRFRLAGRLFELHVETRPEKRAEANAVVSSLRVRPLSRATPRLPSVRMQRTPPLARRFCRASRLLRPACPSRLPAGPYPRAGLFLSPIGRPGSRYDILELNGRRRLVLLASRYGLGKGPLAGWPAEESVGLRVRPKDGKALLSAVRWGSRRGELALDEDHLVFRWRRRGIDYAVAVRVWEPLPAAVAALRAVVLSIPA